MDIPLNILKSNILSLHLSEVLTYKHNFGIHYLEHAYLNCYRGNGMNSNRLTVSFLPNEAATPFVY
jgi:hypothetical protein